MWCFCTKISCYLAGVAGAAGATGAVGAAGVVVVTTLLESVPRGAKKIVATERMTKIAASVQVAFSTTSVVLRTPIIWFDAAKFDASPPPFDS